MYEASAPFAWGNVLEDFALFRTLSSEQRLKALGAMVRRDLVRGQMLVAQGEPSDSLFMVLHGALAVRRAGDLEPIAELRAAFEDVGQWKRAWYFPKAGEDMHAAVLTLAQPFKNSVVRFSFKRDGVTAFHISFNHPKGHLFRVIINDDSLTIKRPLS